MKANQITADVWESAEEVFLKELKERGYNVERADARYDMLYHTDIWMKKDEKLYSIDVKNFSFNYGLFGFYFAYSHSQWGNSQAKKLKEKEGIDIAGEYIIIPYVKDEKKVWAIIDRNTLCRNIQAIKPINQYDVHIGNPNATWELKKGKSPRPLIWWRKQQSPLLGEPIEWRWGIHVDKETFEKLVSCYLDRDTLIQSPSGEVR